jgi:hypothetical protein
MDCLGQPGWNREDLENAFVRRRESSRPAVIGRRFEFVNA